MHATDRERQPQDLWQEDPELMALPNHARRRQQTLWMMALAVIASLLLLLRVRDDVAYFLLGGVHDARAVDLGDMSQQETVGLNENTFVRFTGLPLLGARMTYNGAHNVAPIAGVNAGRLWVLTKQNEEVTTEFYGRLVRASDLSVRLPGASDHTFVLIQGQTPRSVWPSALIALLCVLIALTDVAIALYWFMPLPLPATQRRAA